MSGREANEVDLKRILDSHKREIFLEMNCHAIGEIVSFDSGDQTCVVKISYLKTRSIRNEKGVYVDEHYEYPLLLDCPLMINCSQSAGVTIPVKKGDSCVVLFNDRDIDNWATGFPGKPLASGRAHSISDAIVFVGVRHAKNTLDNYDPDNPHLFNGDMSLKIKEDKVLVTDQVNTLGASLRLLADAIKGIVTTNGGSVNPASQTAIEAAIVQIESLVE